jgi:cell fate regulator YaaT (PSP1 superfamily)
MGTFAEVGFKGTRKEYFHSSLNLQVGDAVIVEADRGEDLGRILALGAIAERKCATAAATSPQKTEPRRILRAARDSEARSLRSLREDEHRVRSETRALVDKLSLKMKVAEAEWQFDRKKLTIFFTAERRVDFRELVRELARTFRTRIELRQIGVRDESALLGGVGRCGRELCSSTWLPELKPVSLQLAKDQQLSLNPSQISGGCGRLMCCLMYEHEMYLQARRRFPREGKILRTAIGSEEVLGVDIWRESITLRGEDGTRRVVSLDELKGEVQSSIRPRGSASQPRTPSPEG